MTELETRRVRTPSFAFGVTLAVILAAIAALLGFARFGDPRHLPVELEKLAVKVRNPRALTSQVTPAWAQLCRAWGSWLGYLERDARRLLRSDELWAPDDPLRREFVAFLGAANEFRPETLVPEAAAEKNLEVLAESPPEAVRNELLTNRIARRVEAADTAVSGLASQLEHWRRWDELRALLKLAQARGFTRVAAALAPRLPPEPNGPAHPLNAARTLKMLDDVSRDEAGLLRLLNRWTEFSRLTAEMAASGDRMQMALPASLLGRLTDQPSLAEFADSLAGPLEEMRLRRK